MIEHKSRWNDDDDEDLKNHWEIDSIRFHKGLPKETTYCMSNNECGATYGKVVLTWEAFKYAWMFTKWRKNLRDKFKGAYYIKTCIPCGNISIPHYVNPIGDKALIKEVNSHAFDVPEYVGDCNY